VSGEILIPRKVREIPLFATGADGYRRIMAEAHDVADPRDPEEHKRRAEAANDILKFTKYTFPQYIIGPFNRSVADALNRVVFFDSPDPELYAKWHDPDYQYVMLFAPPQHGKSELVSTRLPSFFMAHNPDQPVALVSYGGRLADRNSRYARSVLQDPRFSLIPFKSRIRPDYENWRVYDWHIQNGRGYVASAGVGGMITGLGFRLIIIDDPIESWAHAQSETIRESTWQWWLGTLKSRLWEFGRIVLMMTRWHKDDLAGRILDEEGRVEDGGRWKVLSYAALAKRPELDEDNNVIPSSVDILGREFEEPLAPFRYSKEYLIEIRDHTSKLVWNAEYQQTPTDPEGDFFKIGRVEIEEVPPASMCGVHDEHIVDITSDAQAIRFWDLAATKKSRAARDPDYTSGTLMAEGERRFWILDEVRGQLDPEQVADIVKLTARLDGENVKIRIEQEPGASGKTLILAYQKLLAGYDVEGVPASGDPLVRCQALATQLNAGNVVMFKGDWNKPMLAELAGFPNIRHDDQVISAAGAFNEIAASEERWARTKFVRV